MASSTIRWEEIISWTLVILVVLPLYVWSRRGRSYEARWWARSKFKGDITFALLPGAVIVSLGFLAEIWPTDNIIDSFISIVTLGWMLITFIGLMGELVWRPVRRLIYPSWYVSWSSAYADEVIQGIPLGRNADRDRPGWGGHLLYDATGRLWVNGTSPCLRQTHAGLFSIGAGGVWFFKANADFTGTRIFDARWEELIAPVRLVMPWQNAEKKFTFRGCGLTPRLVITTATQTVLLSLTDFQVFAARNAIRSYQEESHED